MRSQHQNVKENEILVVLRFECCKYNAAARCFKLRKVIFPQFCYACSLFSSAFELRLVTFLSHLPEAQKGNYVVELIVVFIGGLTLSVAILRDAQKRHAPHREWRLFCRMRNAHSCLPCGGCGYARERMCISGYERE